jgi:hypothetical protein
MRKFSLVLSGGSGGDGGGEVGFSQDPSGRGFFGDVESAFGFGPDPSNDPSSGFTGSVSGGAPSGSPGDEGVELEVLVVIMKSVA